MRHYYNEIDPVAAAILRQLIADGHIPAGDVDERSIEDVTPADLAGYVQCHFFAGIGGWPLALRLAGWPADQPIWTGSCPCQPFSAAGKGDGFADERHLWPAFHWLIDKCRPPVVVGEQVASAAAGPWLDLVLTDLEALGFAVGAYAGPAAGVGAPHIRDRTYWVAHADSSGFGASSSQRLGQDLRSVAPGDASAPGGIVRLADGHGLRLDTASGAGLHYAKYHAESRGGVVGLADADCAGADGRPGDDAQAPGIQAAQCEPEDGPHVLERGSRDNDGRGAVRGDGLLFDAGRSGPVNGHWRAADWLRCRDGKWRPVEPGTFPLAHDVPARVGRLRGYGNAIVVPQAAEVIRAAFGELKP